MKIIQKAKNFGIEAEIGSIDLKKVMNRMRHLIYEDIEAIKNGLESSDINFTMTKLSPSNPTAESWE